jgi:ADP-ribose pyrophosphatase YjhB (NUDIX family)
MPAPFLAGNHLTTNQPLHKLYGPKTRLAALLRRVPPLVWLTVRLWRLSLPRYTAGVVGVVIDDAGRVLILEHVFHFEQPWGLPGGWLSRREDPETGMTRELIEELGLPVKVERLLLARAHPHRSHLDFAYLCRARGPIAHLSSEILDFGWFDPSELPSLYQFQHDAVAAVFPDHDIAPPFETLKHRARSSNELQSLR